MSNRLTFSLASLIFLIAFGLVFTPVSVMAHSEDDLGTLKSHPHPTGAIGADNNASPPTTAVAEHGTHVTVESITASAVAPTTADNVKKIGDTTYIAITSTTATVKLSVKFDGKVNGGSGADVNSTGVDTSSVLEAGGFEFVLVDENGFTDASEFGSGDGQIAFSSSATTDNETFTFTLTFPNALIPTTTAPQSELDFRIRVVANAAKSVKKSYAGETKQYDGAPTSSSKPYNFKVVPAFPTAPPDTNPPKATITSELSGSNVKFKIVFDKALGTGRDGLQAGDFDVDGGTIVPGTDTVPNPSQPDATKDEYELLVTPDDLAKTAVMLTLRADTVSTGAMGAEGNVEKTHSYDKAPPVLIAAQSKLIPQALTSTKDEDLRKFDVTLVVNEKIKKATIDLGRVGPDIIRQIGDPAESGPDTDGNYTYTTEIILEMEDADFNAAYLASFTKDSPLIVVLKRGLQDTSGNPAFADQSIKYYAEEKDVVKISVDPEPVSCLDGGTVTVSFGKLAALAKLHDNLKKLGNNVKIDITSPGWKLTNYKWDAAKSKITFDASRDLNSRAWLGVMTLDVTVAGKIVITEDGDTNKSKTEKFTIGPVLTVPAGGYIAIVRRNSLPTSVKAMANATANQAGKLPSALEATHLSELYSLYVGDPNVRAENVILGHWDCMPDLELLFNKGAPGVGGGGLIVKQSPDHDPKKPIGAGTVGISEVMWSVDRGIPFGRYSNFEHAREQWIELHNLNAYDVKVTPFALEGNEAYNQVSYDEIDRMGNFNVNDHWEVPGGNDNEASAGSGNSERGLDFIAMARKTANFSKNYVHDDFKGIKAGSWAGSTHVYLTRRAGLYLSGQLPVDQLNYDFIGTPGVRNDLKPSAPTVATVPSRDIIFNEVANREDRYYEYEWIELLNTTSGEINLKKYQLSMVTAKGTDTVLYTFPDNDNIKLAGNSVLLLVAADPKNDRNHPLSGSTPGYVVADLAGTGLPDNGEFVLILRSTNDKKGTASNVVDVAGYHANPNLKDTSKYTDLWPLNVFSAPNLGHNKFGVDTVHYRQHATIDGTKTVKDGNHVDQTAFRDAGYTGIGYRRAALGKAIHGGTPGYKDGPKSLNADVTDGRLTISEIMFDQGNGRKSPQWIELYNSSPTTSVNLQADDGWRLVIENYDDFGDEGVVNEDAISADQVMGTLNFKDSKVQTILPQQTVLVVSGRASSAGSSSGVDAGTVFIDTHVFTVFDDPDSKKALGMSRVTDPILSEKAFYIELIDGKGNVVDMVGNLQTERGRTTGYWNWSEVQGEDELEGGARSSVIRRYREKDVRNTWKRFSDAKILDMGVTAEGWVSAHMTGFRSVSDTWYGNRDDFGTPGTTGGRPLPVSLSKFRPERLDDGSIVIRWITESELNNAGFNILRSETRNGEYTKLNTQLIEGKGTTSERTTYEYPDTSAKPNVVYYYQIQDVSLDGQVQTLRQSRLKGNVSPTGKLTTIWGELKALQ